MASDERRQSNVVNLQELRDLRRLLREVAPSIRSRLEHDLQLARNMDTTISARRRPPGPAAELTEAASKKMSDYMRFS